MTNTTEKTIVHKLVNVIVIACIYIIVCVCAASSADAASVKNATGYVNSSNGANIRSSATTSSKIVRTLPHNRKINILSVKFKSMSGRSKSSKWYKITSGKTTGYLRADLVKGIKYNGVKSRTNDSVNYRGGAGTGMPLYGELPAGAAITVYLKAMPKYSNQLWYLIKVNGRYSYVYAGFVDLGRSGNSNSSGGNNKKPANSNNNNRRSSAANSRSSGKISSKKKRVLKGVDVSIYQGRINWKKVKKAGIDFAIIRQGGRLSKTGIMYTDALFHYNMKNARRNGIPVGAYFFSQAVTEKEAREEANKICNACKGYSVKYPIVIDTEYLRGARANSLSTAKRTKVIKAFCKQVKKKGKTPMIYGSTSWLNHRLNMSQLKDYKVWVAQYYYKCQYRGKYQCWQYTSSGRVNGISGRVDMNKWYR